MIREIRATGKDENEAFEKALAQVAPGCEVTHKEILELPKSGFLGFGGKPALVLVAYDDGRPEEKIAPKGEKKPEKPVEKPVEKPASKPEKPQHFQPEVLHKNESAKPAPKTVSAPVDLGEEVHDEKSEEIRTFLTGLLAHLDSDAGVQVYLTEKDRYKVFLVGDKLGALIGRRGETLDAIQQLTGYAINRGSESKRVRVQVDAENYREKREESLCRLAAKVADKVTKYHKNVTLEPMNAYERHVIHAALQDVKNVNTFSIGSEPNRRVVVAYDSSKQ